MPKRRGEFYLQPNRKCEYATPEEEQQARQAAVEEYLMTLKAILPFILQKFARIPDPRRPGNRRHELTVVMFFGVIAFAFGYESRRQANREGTRPTVLAVLRSVFPEIDSCPHMDTVAGVLESISVEEIERIHIAIVKKLIYNKKFKRMIIDGSYVVAIDGTQKWSGDWMWDHLSCLVELIVTARQLITSMFWKRRWWGQMGLPFPS